MSRMSSGVRLLVPVVLSALLLTGCSGGEPDGQPVEILAGGGSARVDGVLRDLDVGLDGLVRLATTDGDRAFIWTVRPGGAVEKADLAAEVTTVGQIAAGKDGSVYVSAGNSLWKAGGGRIVGNGETGFTADGAAATGPAGEISGVAVDGEGRVVYTEGLAEGEGLASLVRRVEADGTVTTLAGGGTARAADDPPPGTKARDLALTGGHYTVLDVGDDGTVYVNGKESVLAVAPDGTARAVVAGRDPGAVTDAERPFAAEGKAVDARTPLYGTAVPPNLSAAGGRIALTSWTAGKPPAAAFRWTGEYTEDQAAVVEDAFDPAKGSSTTAWPRIRLVDGQGVITTAAWAARAAAIDGSWLYLVIGDRETGLLVGRVRLPETLA